MSYSETHGTYLTEGIDEKKVFTMSSSALYDSSFIGQEGQLTLDERNAILFNVNDPQAFNEYMVKQ